MTCITLILAGTSAERWRFWIARRCVKRPFLNVTTLAGVQCADLERGGIAILVAAPDTDAEGLQRLASLAEERQIFVLGVPLRPVRGLSSAADVQVEGRGRILAARVTVDVLCDLTNSGAVSLGVADLLPHLAAATHLTTWAMEEGEMPPPAENVDAVLAAFRLTPETTLYDFDQRVAALQDGFPQDTPLLYTAAPAEGWTGTRLLLIHGS